MDLISPIILGIVQGLTEFLPISSSGHLVLFQRILGMKEPELLLDISFHIGTLGAVFIVFWKDIKEIFMEGIQRLQPGPRASFRSNEDPRKDNLRLLKLILVGSIPTALIGIIFKPMFEALFSSLLAVGSALMITGGFLWMTRYIPSGTKDPRVMKGMDALVIGFIQGMALTPGISRSGTTIAIGLLLGLEREWSARFSFLLSIPSIIGAMGLQLKGSNVSVLPWFPIIIGSSVALVVGYLALRVLVGIVRRGKLSYFGPYCWVLGLFVILLSLS